ncbi:Epsin-3, clathrin recruitment and traffic between the Golgi and endosome [Thecaphora frezii]
MDFDDLGNKIANLTFYDVKSLYRSARNYALNISEIEAKVDEATNDDPWGASSTLMQEIAAATHNFQDFNEIMPTIYRRFMEKEASEWRQIYKALQLLEYLVKHGSERVVDDARSHLATIKILRNFHYIDEKGKDQGINVRNRAKELSEMLSDVDRIRQERRKARANKNKYTGAGSGGEFVPGSGTGRYGGFGSDSYYAGGGAAAFGSGSGSGGGGSGAAARESFEEYDAGDYEEPRRSNAASAVRPSSSTTRGGRSQAPPQPVKKEEPKVVDLFSFDDDEPSAAPAPTVSTLSAGAAPAPAPVTGGGAKVLDAFGDDFDDFQGAPAPAPAPAAASKPASAAAVAQPANSFDFFGGAPTTGAKGSAVSPPAYAPSGSGVLAPSKPAQPAPPSSSSTAKPASSSSTTGASGSGAGGSFNFDDLWAASSGKAMGAGNVAGKQKMTMAEMAKNQSANAIFGGSSSVAMTAQGQLGQQAAKKGDIFDLL